MIDKLQGKSYFEWYFNGHYEMVFYCVFWVFQGHFIKHLEALTEIGEKYLPTFFKWNILKHCHKSWAKVSKSVFENN